MHAWTEAEFIFECELDGRGRATGQTGCNDFEASFVGLGVEILTVVVDETHDEDFQDGSGSEGGRARNTEW